MVVAVAYANPHLSMNNLRCVIAWAILIGSFVLTACGTTSELAPAEEGLFEEEANDQEPDIIAVATLTLGESSSGASIATPFLLDFPTVVPYSTSVWRPPPYPAPWAIRPNDHFIFSRPIPSGEVNWPNPSYRYGCTLFGEENIHTGVDLSAARGTPVLAASSGEVIWAGYGLYRGTYDETDPYGLAVAILHDFGYQGQKLYSIYAHMQSICVWEGQRVQTGETIGTVGDTGHATGPHLHFEVRLGDNRYWNTRNPELWIVPSEGWGVLAGRLKDTIGKFLPEQLVQIFSLETGQRWDVWSYVEGTVHSDDFYKENFVISDLPAGPYEVRIDFVGRTFTAQFLLHPGQTNLLVFRGRYGFVIEPTPTPVNLSEPPDL